MKRFATAYAEYGLYECCCCSSNSASCLRGLPSVVFTLTVALAVSSSPSLSRGGLPATVIHDVRSCEMISSAERTRR